MPKPSKRRTKRDAGILSAIEALPQRAGLPAKDSIIDVISPAPAPPTAVVSKTRYRIIRTTEMDEYEKGARDPLAAAAAAKPKGDNFKGTARKAAKLSIAGEQTEEFSDLQDLVASLPPESQMTDHTPTIKTGPKSNRVQEEKRNVKVRAFIYAASREDDNDFHLILGRDPQATGELYMTMELSGLPSSSSSSFSKLKAVRDTFKTFFNDNLGGLPGVTYDFPDPPVPVEVEGSLFFDISHANGTRPGPKSLKSRMPVIWEVHPITKMVFEP